MPLSLLGTLKLSSQLRLGRLKEASMEGRRKEFRLQLRVANEACSSNFPTAQLLPKPLAPQPGLTPLLGTESRL